MKIVNIIFFLLLFSCEKKGIENSNSVQVNNFDYNNVDCPLDSLSMKTSEYKGISFFTENTMRGTGVISITIDTEVQILNSDKSLFGKISKSNFDVEQYKIDLPKRTIVRNIIPESEFQIFEFDAENPNNQSDYVTIFINKKQKLIKKLNLNYKYLDWDDYIKSAFIQLEKDVKNISLDEKDYWYTAIKINGDSMLIKSAPKSSCDYIEKYKDITKWIKWKERKCKLIKFNFCY